MPTDFYPPPAADFTYAPYRRTVGQEVEMASGADGAGVLFRAGLAPDSSLHSYGCRCSQRDRYPVHPTSDCTAGGGEYIIGGSRGVLFGSKTHNLAINYLCKALNQVGATHSYRVGMHTHVGTDGMEHQDKLHLVRVYLRYQDDLAKYTALSAQETRSNGCTQATLEVSRSWRVDSGYWSRAIGDLEGNLPGRPTLNFDRGVTAEFRAWNASRVPWRMHMAAGLSSAMVEAAAQGRSVADADLSLVEFLDGIITPDVVELMERQRHYNEKINGRL